MRKAIYNILSTSAAGVLFCGMAFAQQSSAPSAQQPSASKPATTTTTPKKTTTTTPAKPVTLETQKQKASYAIGMNIGRSMKKDGVDIDPEILAKGIKDAISDAKPLLTDDETKAVLTTLTNDVRKHQQEEFQATIMKNKKEGDAFLAENKTKPGVQTTASGLQYKVIQNGDGPKPTANDTVKVNYKGALLNGEEFDSSYKRGQPATFPVGQVIKGWTEALQLMPVGSKWELYIPSELAYGERGTPNGPIGPDETLVFEVELLSIEPKAAPKLEGVPGTGQQAVPAQPQTQQPKAQPQSEPQAQPQSKPQ